MNPDEAAGTLSTTLRAATAGLHREAERSGFVAAMLRGAATPDGLVLWLRNLLPAYAALEAALARRAGEPILGAFARPALFRESALEADLDALAGAAWRDRIALFPEAAAYAAGIADAGAAPDARLAGHAYVRYLGDLSGGQVLRRLLAPLAPGGLACLDFPALDPEATKRELRAALDAVPVATHDAVVEAALEGFRSNIALSAAVERALASARDSLPPCGGG